MINISTRSGIYELPLAEGRSRMVESRLEEAEAPVFRVGTRNVGSIHQVEEGVRR